jgi:hypothetical protein
MEKAPESNAWKRRKKMAQERRATIEIFNELKAIRTEMEQSLVDWPHEHFDRLQELIWKLGEELGEF